MPIPQSNGSRADLTFGEKQRLYEKLAFAEQDLENVTREMG
jgi:hypothetical protein